ncbi:oligosaccharide flippase family protein [Thalassotalea atypica]|uniref:oligosaccharide flippase family protein n=1 Tax=Thalassotalea atypica TaxID=2054316 RepID=UPI002572B728|nr:oligosaccharide flippase family protein [Thalassotalea atypica]
MIRKALAYSFASKYITLIIQIASTLILARILTPEHIGLFTVAAAITGIAQMFRDFGISEYIIKEKDSSYATLSSAFTASVLIAWPIALLIMALTPIVGDFYGHKDIGWLILILSFNMFLSPFGSIAMAVMRKTMNYRPVSIANVANTLVNAIASLAFAYYDFGAFSLAFASVLGTITTVAVITFYKDEETQFGFQLKGVKQVFSFGKNVGGSNIISYIANNVLEILIAKASSVATLGLYSRARSTITLFETGVISAIKPLISPYFAMEKGHKALKAAYLTCTKVILYLSIPFTIIVVSLDKTMLYILFGEQWLGAAKYLSLLTGLYFILTITLFYEQVLTVTSNDKLYMKFKVTFSLLRVGVGSLIFIFPLEHVLLAFYFGAFLRLLWVILSLRKLIELSIREYLKALSQPLIAGTGVLFFVLLYKFQQLSLFEWQLFVYLGLAATFWVTSIFILDKPLLLKLLGKT